MKSLFILFAALFSLPLFALDIEFANDLKGESMPIGVMLSWSTMWEADVVVFEVERSNDGGDFDMVGQIEPKENGADGNKYHFLDAGTTNDKVVYRVKAIGQNNSSALSNTFEMSALFKNDWVVTKISNMETSTDLSIEFESKTAGLLEYRLENFLGDVFLMEQFAANAGGNSLDINMVEYPEDSYRLVMSLNEEQEVLNFKRVYSEEERKTKVLSLKPSQGKSSRN